jgi:predicted LPLAT superfamily acyltransferase
MIEKIAAWSGDIDLTNIRFHDDDVTDLIAHLESGKGAIIICSHVGNMEILRALASCNKTKVTRKFKVTSIVDFTGTAKFNKLIEEINPESMTHLVSAKNMGVETVLDLQDRVSKGELVVIAGDRVSSTTRGKVQAIDFLGEPAAFPQGAFIMASLMEAPVYFMFGLREKDMDPASTYDMHVHKSSVHFGGSRRERHEKIATVIGEYVSYLEGFAGSHPLQWYNFYDFWNSDQTKQENE